MNANPQHQLTDSDRTLYIALELSSSSWKLAFTDQVGRKPRLRTVKTGNLQSLQREIEQAKKRLGLPPDAPVVSCYEAGRRHFQTGNSRKGRGRNITDSSG